MKRFTRIFSICAFVAASFILATGQVLAFENTTVHREWPLTEYEIWQIAPDGTKVEKIKLQLPSTLSIIEEHTAYTMLGLNFYDVDGRPNVLRVNSMSKNLPGERAGMRVDDIVTAFNGQPFTFGNLDWRNDMDGTKQRWRETNNRLTEKSANDLVLTVERNGTTQDIIIKREWIEAERLRRSLDLTQRDRENSPTITIRILPEDFYSIQPDTRDEIVAQWQNEGYVIAMYGFEPPFFRGHAYTASGEVVDIGQFIVMVMAGTKFPGTDEEYQKALRHYDAIKNATSPILLTLEVIGVSAFHPTDGFRVLQDSAKWNVPPDIRILSLHTSIVNIQEAQNQ